MGLTSGGPRAWLGSGPPEDPSLDSALGGGAPPRKAWHLERLLTPFDPAFPRPGPPEGSAQGCLGAPPRGGGSRSQQRQTRPSEIRPLSAGDYCVSFPSDRFIYSPRRRTQSHRQSRGRTKATHTSPGPGCPTAPGGRSPPSLSTLCKPRRGEGTKTRSQPASRPLLPPQPDSGRTRRMSPGPDGGRWDALLYTRRGLGRIHSGPCPARIRLSPGSETGVGEGAVLRAGRGGG